MTMSAMCQSRLAVVTVFTRVLSQVTKVTAISISFAMKFSHM